MDPYRNETMAELIQRKPGNLNILVTALTSKPGNFNARGQIVSDPSQWHSVYVRYNYTPLELSRNDPRLTGFGVPTLGERFDPAAINNLGNRGGFVVVPDIAGIERAISDLKSVWGDIPVQDNSGLVPQLVSK